MIKHMGWVLVLALCGCEVSVNGNGITGSGKLVTEKREIGNFTALDVSGPIDVIVTEEGGPSLEVSGDDNLVKQVETVVNGDTLIVRRRGSTSVQIGIVTNANPLRVKVSVPAVSRVRNGGSGDISLLKWHGDKLDLDNNGSGDIRAEGSIDALTLHNEGSGDIDLSELKLSSLKGKLMGSGDLHLGNVGKGLDLEMSGSGDVRGDNVLADNVNLVMHSSGDVELAGTIKGLNVAATGSGDLSVRGLQATDVNLLMQSSGDASLEGKTQQLSLEVSGSGDFDGSGLEVGRAQAKGQSSGDIHLNTISDNLKANVNGSGDLEVSNVQATAEIDLTMDGPGASTLKGSAKLLVANLSGSGDLDASGMLTDRAQVKVRGSGEADVNVKKAVDGGKPGATSGSRKVKIDRNGVVD